MAGATRGRLISLRSPRFRVYAVTHRSLCLCLDEMCCRKMHTWSSINSIMPVRARMHMQAKEETVNKVMSIVKQQLALGADAALTPESKFTDLGADSLDTVEIVMALEEEFEITVEEDNAQNISTIQEAADLIDKLVG